MADTRVQAGARPAVPEEDGLAAIELVGVEKEFVTGSHDVKAVEHVDLRIAEGEFFSLLGPSGCGKTTTLRMIAGLEDITSGDMIIGGKRVNDLAPEHAELLTSDDEAVASQVRHAGAIFFGAYTLVDGIFAIVAGINYAAAGFLNATIISRTTTSFTLQVEVPYNDSMLDFEEALQQRLNEAGVVATAEGLQQFDTDGSPGTFSISERAPVDTMTALAR